MRRAHECCEVARQIGIKHIPPHALEIARCALFDPIPQDKLDWCEANVSETWVASTFLVDGPTRDPYTITYHIFVWFSCEEDEALFLLRWGC